MLDADVLQDHLVGSQLDRSGQRRHQFVTGAACDEVHHGLRAMGVAQAEAGARADRMLARLHLTHLSRADPFTLSGGEQRRLSVGSALALDPEIVFFDEPSAGLDPVTSRSLDELILAIRATLGTTCVVVSHELDSIFAIADRVIMLDKQARGIIAAGDPRVLARESKDPRVQEFFHRAAFPEAAPNSH